MIAWTIRRLVRALRAVRVVAAYLEWAREIPAPTEGAPWAADDARGVAAFIATPAGGKLMGHLAQRLRDYEAGAAVYGTADTAALLCKRSQGFRDCVAEIRRLSAAGPDFGTPEHERFRLPPELEYLRAD